MKKLFRAAVLAVTAAAAVAGSPASAQVYTFDYSGTLQGTILGVGDIGTQHIDVTGTTDSTDLTNPLAVSNVSVSGLGTTESQGSGTLFSTGSTLNLSTGVGNLLFGNIDFGTLLSTGSSSANILSGADNSINFTATGGSGTLSLTAAVPEPATWAMMLVGFGAVGFSMRRKRTPAAAAIA